MTLCLGCGWLSSCGGGPTRSEQADFQTACRKYSVNAQIAATAAGPASYEMEVATGKIDPSTGSILKTGHDRVLYCIYDGQCSLQPFAQAPRYVLHEVEAKLAVGTHSQESRTITLDQREMVDDSTGKIMARSAQLFMAVPSSEAARVANTLFWSKDVGSQLQCGEAFRLDRVLTRAEHP